MEYVEAYGIGLNFGQTLVAVDGPARKADLHARPTPTAARRRSNRNSTCSMWCRRRRRPISSASARWPTPPAGSTSTRRRCATSSFANVFALGDAANTTNAKTAAAARKQAPVVAHNLLVDARRGPRRGAYDGYGSCPLTVERGKIVLAEFGYGGKLAPSFPTWLIDGTRPSRLAWYLKERILPPLYWDGDAQGPRMDGAARNGRMSAAARGVARHLPSLPILDWGTGLRPRHAGQRPAGGADRHDHADPAEPGLRAAGGAAARGRAVRERRAAAALRAVRHQPRAGGGPGGGGLADDGGGHRRVRRRGLAGLLGGGDHAGLPVGRDAAARWACCGWASSPTSSATR